MEIDGVWYYFKADGHIAMGEFIRGWWLNSKTGACTYKFKAAWHKNSKGWWYGDGSGWFAKNKTYKIDGVAYLFDEEGYTED